MELRCSGNMKLSQIKSIALPSDVHQSGRGIWEPNVVIASTLKCDAVSLWERPVYNILVYICLGDHL